MSDSSKDTILFAGIDLSLTGTGVVLLDEKGELKHQKLIKSKKDGDRPIDELLRLERIRDEVEKEIMSSGWEPKIVCVEGLAFMARNTTALVQLAALNYLIRGMLYSLAIDFVIVAPTTLKKFVTGKGNADKNIVLMEIYKRYDQTFTDDNLGDAYGLAQIALSIHDGEFATTQEQKAVLKTLEHQYAKE